MGSTLILALNLSLDASFASRVVASFLPAACLNLCVIDLNSLASYCGCCLSNLEKKLSRYHYGSWMDWMDWMNNSLRSTPSSSLRYSTPLTLVSV